MRLIDADKIVYSWQIDADGQEHDGVTLKSIIDKIPTIDTEIIHCRECKYWNPHNAECEGIGNWFGFEGAWSENGYCYKAERREDG